MYSPQETAKRIKEKAKERKIPISKVLDESGLSKNTITKMSDGADVYTQSIAKIATTLKCSVDYLIGTESNIKNEDDEEARLIYAYRSLTDEGKKAVLMFAEVSAQNPQYQKYTDIPKEA